MRRRSCRRGSSLQGSSLPSPPPPLPSRRIRRLWRRTPQPFRPCTSLVGPVARSHKRRTRKGCSISNLRRRAASSRRMCSRQPRCARLPIGLRVLGAPTPQPRPSKCQQLENHGPFPPCLHNWVHRCTRRFRGDLRAISSGPSFRLLVVGRTITACEHGRCCVMVRVRANEPMHGMLMVDARRRW